MVSFEPRLVYIHVFKIKYHSNIVCCLNRSASVYYFCCSENSRQGYGLNKNMQIKKKKTLEITLLHGNRAPTPNSLHHVLPRMGITREEPRRWFVRKTDGFFAPLRIKNAETKRRSAVVPITFLQHRTRNRFCFHWRQGVCNGFRKRHHGLLTFPNDSPTST